MNRHPHFLRRGSIMIELAVGLIILAVLYGVALRSMKTSKESYRAQKELDFYDTFDRGIKSSFELITDSFEQRCSAVTGSAQTGWGWKHVSCNQTSPLPVFDGTGTGEKIVYNIQFSSLNGGAAGADATILKSNIKNAFAPYCTESSSSATQLVLRCGNLVGLTYDLGGGGVASAHTVGNDIDPTIAPSYTLTYHQRREVGNISQNVTFNGTLATLWEKRQNYSLEKMNTLSEKLKSFYNGKLMSEVGNTAPTGLNSIDDEFVPWFWEALGSNTASVASDICSVTAGSCTNLSTSGTWKTTTPTWADIWMRVIPNIGNNNWLLDVDGFGNMLRLLPIASSTCTDYSTCSLSAPALPADNYYTGTLKPPYSSAIFTLGCSNNTLTEPSYCRRLITY